MDPARQLTDRERDAAVTRLNAAVEAGELDLTAFSDRVGAAYAARTRAELDALVAGLPAESARQPEQRTFVGSIKRGGRWHLPAYTAISTAIGTVKLDLREAAITGVEAAVAVHVGTGTVKIWVPAKWRVEIYGKSTIGSRYVEENHLPPDPDTPTLRLRLDTFLGTVNVYRV